MMEKIFKILYELFITENMTYLYIKKKHWTGFNTIITPTK